MDEQVPGRVWVVGSLNEDLTVATRRIPKPGETVLASSVTRSAGGKGANQAVAAARAGARTVMVGAVGPDEAGDRLRSALGAERIDTTSVRRTDGPTGLALITVDGNGENSIVVVPGANASVTVQDVERSLAGLAPADVVIAQGEVPVAAIEAAGQCSLAVGATFVLNLAPVVDVAWHTAAPGVLVLNEHEAAMLDPTGEGSAQRARRLREHVGGALVVTMGAAGALVATSSGVAHAEPVRARAVVDTTGAGDAFVGALAAGLAGRRGLDQAVRWGLVAGAVAVGAAGAQGGRANAELISRALQLRRLP